MKDYRFLQKKYLVATYPDRGLTFVEGKGPYLFNQSGDKYLDLMTNYGVNIFGHCHPQITEKIKKQLTCLTTLHGSFSNDMRAKAADSLVKRCGGGLSQVYFSSSGAEAVEAALKFAVLAKEKKTFIACRNGYHGKTLGALSAAGSSQYKDPFMPLLWDFRFVDFNRISQLAADLDNDVAGFLVEPIQGEGGVQVPDRDYLQKVRRLCEAKKVLLILDEIQTGVGRTGSFLASQQNGMDYDIVCLGKGLAGGLPVGATLVSPAVANKISRSIHTSTFGGNPLVGAGILATLDLLDDNMLASIQSLGNYFLKKLDMLQSDIISRIKGMGLMLGVEVRSQRDLILKKLQEAGILAIPAGKNVARFLPPYILTKVMVDEAVAIMQEVLNNV